MIRFLARLICVVVGWWRQHAPKRIGGWYHVTDWPSGRVYWGPTPEAAAEAWRARTVTPDANEALSRMARNLAEVGRSAGASVEELGDALDGFRRAFRGVEHMETTTDRQERSKSTGRGVHVTRKSYEFVPFEPGQDGGAREVWILHDGTRFCPLPPRLDLRNHSPSGFDWGGAGSGCAQLALAILADAADRTVAEELYQTFKNGVIAVMGTHPHPMFAETVRRWCAAVREGDPVRICSIEGQLLSEGAEA